MLKVLKAQVSTLKVVQQLPIMGLPCDAAGSDVSLGFTPRTAASGSGAVKYDSSAESVTTASRILSSSGPPIEPAMGGAAAASRLPLFRAHPVLKTLAAAERAIEQTPGAGAFELFACDASLSPSTQPNPVVPGSNFS